MTWSSNSSRTHPAQAAQAALDGWSPITPLAQFLLLPLPPPLLSPPLFPLSALTACLGPPTANLLNGKLPKECWDTPAGSVCTGTCNKGYAPRDGPTLPTVACVADPNSKTGASWAPLAGECIKGM